MMDFQIHPEIMVAASLKGDYATMHKGETAWKVGLRSSEE